MINFADDFCIMSSFLVLNYSIIMTKFKIGAALAGLCLLISSCSTSTGNGALIGAGGGAALGALAGRLLGGNAKGTAIGAAVGAAVGGGTGALIGKHMDKKKAAAQAAAQAANAQLTEVVDANGLKAYKFEFNESGVRFATNKADLNDAAKSNIASVANFLKNNTDCDVAVVGHTDSTGSDAINNPLSEKRAQSVSNYMKAIGVSSAQVKSVMGMGSSVPEADNSTAEGRSKNRRVEVYVYANAATIAAAEKGELN